MSQPLRHTGINTPASPNHWVTKSPRPCPGTRRVATIASHRHQHPGESQPLRHKAPKVLPRNPACPSHCVTQASTPQRVPTIASQSPQDPAREPGVSQPLRHTGINTPASPNHWVTKPPRPCPRTRRVPAIASHRHQHPSESQPLGHKAHKTLPRNPACPSHCVTKHPRPCPKAPGASQPLRHKGINTPCLRANLPLPTIMGRPVARHRFALTCEPTKPPREFPRRLRLPSCIPALERPGGPDHRSQHPGTEHEHAGPIAQAGTGVSDAGERLSRIRREVLQHPVPTLRKQ